MLLELARCDVYAATLRPPWSGRARPPRSLLSPQARRARAADTSSARSRWPPGPTRTPGCSARSRPARPRDGRGCPPPGPQPRAGGRGAVVTGDVAGARRGRRPSRRHRAVLPTGSTATSCPRGSPGPGRRAGRAQGPDGATPCGGPAAGRRVEPRRPLGRRPARAPARRESTRAAVAGGRPTPCSPPSSAGGPLAAAQPGDALGRPADGRPSSPSCAGPAAVRVAGPTLCRGSRRRSTGSARDEPAGVAGTRGDRRADGARPRDSDRVRDCRRSRGARRALRRGRPGPRWPAPGRGGHADSARRARRRARAAPRPGPAGAGAGGTARGHRRDARRAGRGRWPRSRPRPDRWGGGRRVAGRVVSSPLTAVRRCPGGWSRARRARGDRRASATRGLPPAGPGSGRSRHRPRRSVLRGPGLAGDREEDGVRGPVAAPRRGGGRGRRAARGAALGRRRPRRRPRHPPTGQPAVLVAPARRRARVRPRVPSAGVAAEHVVLSACDVGRARCARARRPWA